MVYETDYTVMQVLNIRVVVRGKETFVNLIGLDIKLFLKTAKPEEKIVLAGGDGSLNHFINDLGDMEVPSDIYLLPIGAGNDFLNDVKEAQDEETSLLPLCDYISNLPIIEVKDKKYRFINGIGFDIDGEEMKLKKTYIA